MLEPLDAVTHLAALAGLASTLPWLGRLRLLRDGGPLGWDLLRNLPRGRRRLARWLAPALGPPVLTGLLAARLAGLLLMAVLGTRAPVACLAAALAGAALMRLRAGYLAADGADNMEFTVLGALLLSRAGPAAEPAALAFCGGLGLFAYFQAGLGKLKEPGWRSGRTLEALGLPGGRPAAWLVIGGQLAAPACLLGPVPAGLWLAGAALFHLGTALFLGRGFLRFLPAFGATYPAVFWLASR